MAQVSLRAAGRWRALVAAGEQEEHAADEQGQDHDARGPAHEEPCTLAVGPHQRRAELGDAGNHEHQPGWHRPMEAEEPQRHPEREHRDRGDRAPVVSRDEVEERVSEGEHHDQQGRHDENRLCRRGTQEREHGQCHQGHQPAGDQDERRPAAGVTEGVSDDERSTEETEASSR